MQRRTFITTSLIGLITAPFLGRQVIPPQDVPNAKRMGVLTYPGQLRPEECEMLRRSWDAAVKSGKPIVLMGGLKYEEFTRPDEVIIR